MAVPALCISPSNESRFNRSPVSVLLDGTLILNEVVVAGLIEMFVLGMVVWKWRSSHFLVQWY